MNSLAHLLTTFLPKTPYVWTYMLQQVEYDTRAFTQWLKRRPDYRKVMKRKSLVRTAKAKLLLAVAYSVWLLCWLLSFISFISGDYLYGAIFFLLAPSATLTVLHLVTMTGAAALLMSRRKILAQATEKLAQHQAVKIAVIGSYGKTTMKELLATVLGEAKKVAATPGNNNVPISHSRWVMNRLGGDEEILVVEFGEFRPGDIAAMATMFRPDMAIITGVAPNHLENYPNYEALKDDLTSIRLFVAPDKLFVPKQTAQELGLTGDDCTTFDASRVLDWKVKDVQAGLEGTEFTLEKQKQTSRLRSGLIGKHLIAPIALAAALAADFGASKEQIETGVAKTRPYEHRMQPLHINGALVVDDTYNGNIEGMRAGLELLRTTEARRKLYVTPGLVEQGSETAAVHTELGRLIAKAKPDVVVLMENSVRPIIEHALKSAGYTGELRIETDPRAFYEHLQYQVAAGDVVLMQNDWTDNYN